MTGKLACFKKILFFPQLQWFNEFISLDLRLYRTYVSNLNPWVSIPQASIIRRNDFKSSFDYFNDSTQPRINPKPPGSAGWSLGQCSCQRDSLVRPNSSSAEFCSGVKSQLLYGVRIEQVLAKKKTLYSISNFSFFQKCNYCKNRFKYSF